MMIKEERIREFQKIYKDAFKIEISIEDAYEQGTKLINLFKSIYDYLVNSEKKDLK